MVSDDLGISWKQIRFNHKRNQRLNQSGPASRSLCLHIASDPVAKSKAGLAGLLCGRLSRKPLCRDDPRNSHFQAPQTKTGDSRFYGAPSRAEKTSAVEQ